MDAMFKQKPYDLREYGPKIREYAFRGYNEVMAYAESLASQAV
jgi:hypothetical protein